MYIIAYSLSPLSLSIHLHLPIQKVFNLSLSLSEWVGAHVHLSYKKGVLISASDMHAALF
jgi:hypothetical protein